MDRYKNKYRIASARGQWWDYGWNEAYFITICTQNREHFFGEINEGKMALSRLGVIADVLWQEIPNHSKYAVETGHALPLRTFEIRSVVFIFHKLQTVFETSPF